MPVHGDGQDGQTDLDIMANDISYGAGFFDQSMSGYDMNDGGEFFLDSDNSPIPIDGFDEPPSPTNSFGHAPMKSSSRSSVADSGSSSEGKQSSIGTGLTGIDTHADKELVVKQEWSGAGISNYFGENGLQPDTFYTAASSPSHLDGSFNAGLDLSPNTTTNMRDLDLSVQTTNMQSLELRSPVYSPHTTMHALAPDAMLQNATNSYTFGSHHNLMPFNFGSARNAVGKGASPEPNPFSPSMLPQPSPIVPSPIAQQYNGLPSGPYPGPYPQLRMGDFENSQMVSAAAPFPLANPAPQAPAQPRFNGKLLYGSPPYTLEIWDNCLDARRSRVETQIRVVLAMSHLPPGVKRLHLPTYTISKPKLVAKPTPEPSSDMLELHVSVVCTSAVQKPHQMQAARDRARKASEKVRSKPALPSSDSGEEVLKPQDGGEVFICNGCICRERKRIARKKNNKRQDEEELWKEDEKYRAIVFNNAEVLDWNSPQSPVDELGQPQSTSGHGQLWTIPAAMRLACYCRHHTEKMGYNVIFTLTDYKGQFIAQSVLKSIFITDDHKTSNQANLTTSIPGAPRLANGHEFHVPPLNHEFISNSNSSMSMSGAVPGSQVQMSQQGSSARILSRSVSPVAYPSERKKMRKTSDTSKLAVGANMPSLDATMFSAQQPPNSASAFPPTPPQCSDMSVFGPSSARPADRNRGPYSSNPPTPSHYQRGPFANLNATAAGIDHANPGVYSGLTSMHQSRATSPATVINTNTINMRPNPALAIRTQPEMGLAPGLANTGAVAIHKVIPGEGSVMGGMDVTILGENFQGGMEVMFGNTKAVTTTFWGEKTLVCLVPPAAAPGRVQVTIKDHELTVPGNPQFFNYTNDADVQLLRTALAVLGGKLTGNNFNDVIGWANQFNNQFVQQQSSGSSSGNDASGAGGGTRYNRATESDFESQLINLLKMMDLAENSRPVRFNLRRKTGQTMMHLACHMGFARFVDGLLIRGANPDARDRGGYTPLHMAALAGHLDIVSLLIAKGADTTIRTLSGVTAMDIASSETVRQAIGRFGLQTRSRSGVSLPSRANSTVDFKIQPLTNTSTNAVDSGEESPEYSTFATSEEDALSEEEGSSEEEQEEWLDMQHKGISKNLILEDKPARRHRRPTDIVGGFGLPATAMTTLKEHMSAQFQQLHQSMQQHLPNLPQLPQLPQIAQFAQLPQFSYLPQMPNIPNLPPALKERDWWLFLSSLAYSNAAQNTQAPPAYNEIFPHDRGSLDDKQASAVQAAVEAAADVKCSALYDQAGSLSSNVDNAQDVVDVKKAGFVVNAKSSKAGVVVEDKEPPTLLQIGRKNAITKEQQENFLRARAAKLKEMSWDKNLFFIWIPILIAMATLWLYSHSPRFAEAAWKLTSPVRGFVLGEVQ